MPAAKKSKKKAVVRSRSAARVPDGRRLGAHIVHAHAVALVIDRGTNEHREDVVAHTAAASDRGWDAKAERHVAIA